MVHNWQIAIELLSSRSDF